MRCPISLESPFSSSTYHFLDDDDDMIKE